MKQKDIFVGISFVLLTIGLGVVVSETPFSPKDTTGLNVAAIEPAAGDENVQQVTDTQETETKESVSSNTISTESSVTNNSTTQEQSNVPSVPSSTPQDSAPESDNQEITYNNVSAERSFGSATAPIVIYEYSSLTCPHCAVFHLKTFPHIKKDYIDTGKVRYVFKPFPINIASLDGTMLAHCLPTRKYEKIVDLMFTNQNKWAFNKTSREDLFNLVHFSGVDRKFFDECLNNDMVKSYILGSMQDDGKKYNVQATPTFIINEGKFTIRGAVPYSEMKEKIDRILETVTTTSDTMNTTEKSVTPN